MKKLIFIILIAFSLPAFSQSVKLEAQPSYTTETDSLGNEFITSTEFLKVCDTLVAYAVFKEYCPALQIVVCEGLYTEKGHKISGTENRYFRIESPYFEFKTKELYNIISDEKN